MRRFVTISAIAILTSTCVIPVLAHKGGHWARILGPGAHDKPGPPMILTNVHVGDVLFPFDMYYQDSGGYAEPVLTIIVEHQGHGKKKVSISEPELGWVGPGEGLGTWTIDRDIYMHDECTPMEPITLTVNGMEADASGQSELERKVLTALDDLAELLDLLAELFGYDTPIGAQDLLRILIWLFSVLNPDDSLGTAIITINSPGLPQSVRTQGGDYEIIVDFLASATPIAGDACDPDSVPPNLVPPPQCASAPAFFDSLRDAWSESQNLAIESGNPSNLSAQDLQDAVTSIRSGIRQVTDWVALEMVHAAWGYQGASTALGHYQNAILDPTTGSFNLYKNAFCTGEAALRGAVPDPGAGPMPTLTTAAPKMVATRSGRTAKFMIGVFGSDAAGVGIESVSGGPPGALYNVTPVPSRPWYELSITQYGPEGTYNVQVDFTDPELSPIILTLDVDAAPVHGGLDSGVNHDLEVAGDGDARDLGQAFSTAQLQNMVWIANWSFDTGSTCSPAGWTKTGTGSGGTGAGHLLAHVTDNDICSENTTCAWLFTDPTAPLIACDPSLSFGPGGLVLDPGLDEYIVSPVVSLASTPGAPGTAIDYRIFPGNAFHGARMVSNWSVRSMVGGFFQPWQKVESFGSLGRWGWLSRNIDLTPYIDPQATDIQVRFRVSDWGPGGLNHATTAGSACGPGPGPYVDAVRIGRRLLTGPAFSEGMDSRSQAQDCFSAALNAFEGEHYSPTQDPFGTCPLSAAADEATQGNTSAVVERDEIGVKVVDARNAGGITAVQWLGAIVAGPHQGKAPAPYTIGGNGFFTVAATAAGNEYSVDLDDTYFRGGDVLHYLWTAQDAGGGFTSNPAGLTAAPASRAAAELALGGLFEVSYLPAIAWAPAYLARIAADPHGDLAPTAQELAASSQQNCILYVQMVNSRRRTGDVNRTSFMYALDRLGYRGHYDVYDVQGFGNTNNQLASRATVQQLARYALIVQDSGSRRSGQLPDGTDLDGEKVDQATFYRNYLSQAAAGPVGFATLWMIGANLVEEKPTNALYTTNMGTALATRDQGMGISPDIDGVTSFTFDRGTASALVDFAADLFTLKGGCPERQDYDGLTPSGTGVQTHRYRNPATGTLGPAAVVMNRNNAENWNTILQTHPWSDIHDDEGTPDNPPPVLALLSKVLGGVLPANCLQSPIPTYVEEDDAIAAPRQTFLYQNVPNPFNPTTVIRFDLASQSHVQLSIFDVSGRLVRALVDEPRPQGRYEVPWDGRDQGGTRVASGIYLYRLSSAGFLATRKMVVMK